MVSVNSSDSATDCGTTSTLTLRKAVSIDMPDSIQISSRSSASGNARRIDSCRFEIAFFRNSIGACRPSQAAPTHMPILIGNDFSICEITNTYSTAAMKNTTGVTRRKNRNVT